MELAKRIKPTVVGQFDDTPRKIIAVGYDAQDNLMVVVTIKGEKVRKGQEKTLAQLMKHVPLGITLDTKAINQLRGS